VRSWDEENPESEYNEKMEYNKLSHCVYKCEYHIVLVTKYRRNVFNEGIFAYMKKRLAEIGKYYPTIRIEEINHDRNHVHLLISIPPTIAVGKVVGIIKANTGKGLKQKFPIVKKIYWGTDSLWSEGYFVSTSGINENIVKKYIQMQGNEDSGQAKLEIT